jgi:arsenite methyltransferase
VSQEHKSFVTDWYAGRARELPTITEEPVSFGLGDVTSLARIEEGETVLDLGSGPGRDLLAASVAAGPSGRVIGVDLVPEMIERATASASVAGATNVSVVQGDLEALPIPSGSIDAVISNCVINLVPDKRAALAEAFRVLRPGGRFAVLDIAFKEEPPASLREDSASWAGCVAGAMVEGEYVQALKEIGFSDVRLDPINQSSDCCDSDCCGSTVVSPLSVAVTASKPAEATADSPITIRPAVSSDVRTIQAILGDAGLPLDGLRFEDALLVLEEEVSVGTVALERYGPASLLRSLAVTPDRRGSGLGTRLTRAALEVAGNSGSSDVYLLTASAKEFFERIGFAPVSRGEAASAVPSKEFDLGCCDPATVMKLTTVNA